MDYQAKITFYVRRLQSASLPELLCRAREFLFLARLRTRVKKGAAGLPDVWISPADLQALQLPDWHWQEDEAQLQALLDGKVYDLNGDPKAIALFEEACRGVFSPDLTLPQNSPDIRMVWEPARLQHLILPLWTIRYRPTRSDLRTLKEFVKVSLLAWLANNPFLSGPHYLSALECGLRIPVFFYALKLLDILQPGEYRRIGRAIYEHGWWVAHRLSLFSSLGNHTIGEAVGLVFSGAVFRLRPEGRAWLQRGTSLLQQELGHQILADGGPAEQSLQYHRFVLDLYWLALDFLERNGLYHGAPWRPRLFRGEQFLQTMAAADGSFPAIGDSDDGQAVAPGVAPTRGLQVCAHDL